MKKYKLLSAVATPDKKELSEYAILLQDIALLKNRLNKLERIRKNNCKKLEKYIWRDEFGKYESFFDLSDQHISNIMKGTFLESLNEDQIDMLEELAEDRGIAVSPILLEAGTDF